MIRGLLMTVSALLLEGRSWMKISIGEFCLLQMNDHQGGRPNDGLSPRRKE